MLMYEVANEYHGPGVDRGFSLVRGALESHTR